MPSSRFDELTKSLATSTSRRQALQHIAGALAGGLLATLVPGHVLADNSDCAHWCDSNFPPGPERGQCKSEAAQGTGPCYQCGPAAPPDSPPFCGQTCCSSGQECCSGTCTNVSTDPNNCGVCGLACPSGDTCVHGSCCNAASGGAGCGKA